VISRYQRELLQRQGGTAQLLLSNTLGCLAALLLPLLFIVCGAVVDVLARPMPETAMALGRWLPNIRGLLPPRPSPLSEVTQLLVIALGAVLLEAALLFAFYQHIQRVAMGFETAVIRLLRQHSHKLATVRSHSGQQTALLDGLEYQLPRVRASLARWWRAWPRHLVQLLACGLRACLIQPLLALLTLVCAALVLLTYRTLDQRRRTLLPVVRERATQRRNQVVALCLTGPLLESVHSEGLLQAQFESELTSYHREAVRSLANSSWKTPLLVALTGVLGCLFAFVVADQILQPDGRLSLAGALTFVFACVGLSTSALRLQRSARELRSTAPAAEDLLRFLAIPIDELRVHDARPVDRLTSRIDLDHVTLLDNAGRRLLEDIQLSLPTGQLIGIVATHRLQAQALMELLLGIGRPVSGRMLLDGVSTSEMDPQTLRRLGIWVSAQGPLITDSLENNLQGDTPDPNAPSLLDVLKATRCLDAVQRLAEGTATLVTPDDDRFTPDIPFRLGIARALLRRTPIIVMEEPELPVDARTEQETIEAVRAVVKHNTLSLILPQRLASLRQCDRIIVLHDNRVSDVGTHGELLQRSDLYRHLNYVRFSPLRHIAT
jgi:ATP-binding cassette, subfamily B, bacterial